MKSRIINLCIILASLVGYLEWGKDNKMFLFQGEVEIIIKLFKDTASVIHPLTLLPLLGQIILVFTLFQKKLNRLLSLIGLGCLSVLLVFMFLIGILALNFKILVSTIPFLLTGLWAMRHYWKQN